VEEALLRYAGAHFALSHTLDLMGGYSWWEE
jgi:hypothetical protein